jgi:tetratricopeptide (TPR) repeat protein
MGWRWMVVALGLGLSAQAARADELRAPSNVNVEPTSRPSSELTTRSAGADMQGNPQQAVQLADQAIRADPRNAWAYYDKGMALAEMRETDGAIAALYAAEQHFPASDKWGRSIAMYGRAHTLSQAGRCAEAVQAFAEYASFVGKDDPKAAEMARRYAIDCHRPGSPPPNVPQPRAR